MSSFVNPSIDAALCGQPPHQQKGDRLTSYCAVDHLGGGVYFVATASEIKPMRCPCVSGPQRGHHRAALWAACGRQALLCAALPPPQPDLTPSGEASQRHDEHTDGEVVVKTQHK